MSRVGQQLQAASPTCGRATTVTLDAREYILRPPLEPCRPTAPLPLMVLIHCFGCDAASEIQKYSEAADAHGFVLAAPEGYQNSWNAPHCCGPARDEGYDDVGFIDAVVKHSGSLLPIAPDAIFAAGFSMVSWAAPLLSLPFRARRAVKIPPEDSGGNRVDIVIEQVVTSSTGTGP